MAKACEQYHLGSLHESRLTGGVLYDRQKVNREVTLGKIEEKSLESGHTAYMSGHFDPCCDPQPHSSWGNDIFKWLEAISYSLIQFPDPALEAKADAMIEVIEKGQQPDGYWNPYYTYIQPGQRWTRLAGSHEMFTAGHMITAAVAYYRATGKDRFLNVARRFADCMADTFGEEPGKLKGYDGHQGVKMALMDLYEETHDERYLRLVQYFVSVRGTQPCYFEIQRERNGGESSAPRNDDRDYFTSGKYVSLQSHKPVIQQTEAEGHAVRYVFQMVGVMDLVLETGDEALWELTQKAWNDIVNRKMYLTGGIGSTCRCEAFTYAYDLNNELAYNETCGAVYMVIWAAKMLQKELNGSVGDVMEVALFNTALSGVSLSGDKFFYCNPLAVYPKDYRYAHNRLSNQTETRQPWFRTACCPPNLAKLLSGLSRYLYSSNDTTVAVHLYAPMEFSVKTAGQTVSFTENTDYPYNGSVQLTVTPEHPAEFTLCLRIPGWCPSYQILINGAPVQYSAENGYVFLTALWNPGDVVVLNMEMPVRTIAARPEIRWDAGRLALMRGPLVYCVEETDMGTELQSLRVSRSARWKAVWNPELLGGTVTLHAQGEKMKWDSDTPYQDIQNVQWEEVEITAIPYFLWDNRTAGEMTVFLSDGGR